MRRAVYHEHGIRHQPATSPQSAAVQNGFGPRMEYIDSSSIVASLADGAPFADSAGDVEPAPIEQDSERSRYLALAIVQRIEMRLPGRVRNLKVKILADAIVLEGQCATYYTKQLAQHAALGILEDEHLENAIVVTVGR